MGLGLASMAASLLAPTPRMQASAAGINDAVSWLFLPPPQPVMFPRRALDTRFAVLLMRSSYEAVDDLDFIPMDKFQKEFWRFRASEQEGYNLQYSPLKPRIGDLTDPLYFDFISYSQYAVIGREMANGQMVFKEYCDECEPEKYRVIRRDPSLSDNARLPERFNKLVGDKIYSGLLNGFREEVFGAPAPLPAGSSDAQLIGAVSEIVNIFVDRGFALRGSVDRMEASDGRGFTVKLQGPANLWGLASLSFRRSSVVNAFDQMAIAAYLRACGHDAVVESSYSESGVEQMWTLTA